MTSRVLNLVKSNAALLDEYITQLGEEFDETTPDGREVRTQSCHEVVMI